MNGSIRRIRLTQGTTLTNVEGKDVLFSVRTGDSYGLNETAARMLRLAIETGISDAASQLASEYNVAREELASDLDQIVGELIQLKLAEACPDHGG